MIGGGQISPTRALVHHVQQEYALLTVILELLEVLALDGC